MQCEFCMNVMGECGWSAMHSLCTVNACFVNAVELNANECNELKCIECFRMLRDVAE